jgi:hypothetical protein
VAGINSLVGIPFVIGTLPVWQRTRNYNESDEKYAVIMQAYWSNFAKRGDPNGASLVKWPKFDPAARAFASLAVAEDDLPRAARLWGAARALSSAGGVGLADFVDERFNFYGRPNARFVIDPEMLERYAQEGRAMTLDESVAYALETTIDDLAPHDHVGTAR